MKKCQPSGPRNSGQSQLRTSIRAPFLRDLQNARKALRSKSQRKDASMCGDSSYASARLQTLDEDNPGDQSCIDKLRELEQHWHSIKDALNTPARLSASASTEDIFSHGAGISNLANAKRLISTAQTPTDGVAGRVTCFSARGRLPCSAFGPRKAREETCPFPAHANNLLRLQVSSVDGRRNLAVGLLGHSGSPAAHPIIK